MLIYVSNKKVKKMENGAFSFFFHWQRLLLEVISVLEISENQKSTTDFGYQPQIMLRGVS